MSYVLNQFNQAGLKEVDVSSATSQTYMTVLNGGTAKRKKNASDSGVSGSSLDPFHDECLQLNYSLTPGVNYYFHTKIKRLNSNQTFYVYLVNYNESQSSTARTQYLKTITVQGGTESEWVDFEMLFTPIISFDTILFQLQRTIEDYREDTRYPVIIYEELSRVNNMISSKIKNDVELIKIGVQSHPGLMMCLNGEEIHIGRSGIYEVRNGVILVSFLSMLFGADENINGSNPLRNPETGEKVTLEEYLAYIASLSPIVSETDTNSKCIFDNSKIRNIDGFTLDYMYEEE